MRKKRKFDAYIDLSDILKEYGQNRDRCRLNRRLSMQAYNYAKKNIKVSELFKLIKTEINKG